jgi:RNA polymerase sigma-70 factor (ECF subfamily)
MVKMSILEAFLTAVSPQIRSRLQRAELEEVLAARCSAARHAWPQLDVPADEFGAFLAERMPPDARSATALHALRVEELLLTCACARGSVTAIKLLEQRYFPMLLAALGRMRLPASKTQEVRQVLREQLFVGYAGQRPRIANYAGRGDLGSWLSVSAVRAAYKLLRKERREVSDEDEHLASLSATSSDVEIGYIKRSCRSIFRASFSEALSVLAAREKNLLRQHYLDGLTLDQIAALYKTHRATAARWLATARKTLLERTREALQRRLRAPLADCESIIHMAQSGVEMTFHSLFAVEESRQ